MFGCYAFPTHVGVGYPEHAIGVDVPTLRACIAERLRAVGGPGTPTPEQREPEPSAVPDLVHEPGCAVDGGDRSGIAAAVRAAAASDVCVLAVGDRAGMFGRGTSGEGCDAADLRLPGVQADLARAVLASGTPVVLVVVSGRPYALGPEFDAAAAIVQAFFPGQRGGQALAEVLLGAVEPSGRLPVSVPRDTGGVPATYLAPPLGRHSDLSSVDPTPAFPFGHGLSYTTFEWTDAGASTVEWPTDGEISARITVRNTGDRPGTDVVQLYLHDPVAQTTRPVVRLIGYARVALDPGGSARVVFTVPADVTSFTGRHGRRIVEPGDVELRFGRSSAQFPATVAVRLTGPERVVGPDRRFEAPARIEAADPVDPPARIEAADPVDPPARIEAADPVDPPARIETTGP
jgi:beta-glucosidase